MTLGCKDIQIRKLKFKSFFSTIKITSNLKHTFELKLTWYKKIYTVLTRTSETTKEFIKCRLDNFQPKSCTNCLNKKIAIKYARAVLKI